MIDFKDIEKELTVNFSISELEKRLQPHNLDSIRTTHGKDSWNDYSIGGFLAPDEKLLPVIEKDYETLVSLNTNYDVIARIASNVLSQYEKDIDFNKKEPLDKALAIIRYTTRPIITLDRKHFDFVKVISMGNQTCPWGCKGNDLHGYSTKGSSHIIVSKKGQEMPLINRYLKGEKNIVPFGGMNRMSYLDSFTIITDLTPHLIASHYFFQGEASYRTDPKKLLEITGRLD